MKVTDARPPRSTRETVLAKRLADSIDRHQTRGLSYAAHGLEDVVIHGRVNLLAVAEDVWSAALRQTQSPRRSWSAWFAGHVESRRIAAQDAATRALWAQLAADDPDGADAALARLRLRDENSPWRG